jgi:hypothetical protein
MRYQLDDFLQVGKPLGSGSYGHVAKVVHKGTSDIFAMKVIPKAKIVEHEMTAYLAREVKTQMGLHHPHILKLHYYFEDKESVQLLLEFAAGGSLFQRLKKEHKLPEPEAARIFTDVADALVFLHGNDIVHRDLKPENILICDGDVAKLADFGWCADLKNGPERNTFCGTVEYLSPEMVGGEAHDRTVDVWAMGILMYEMLTGGSPFAAKNPTKTFGKIANVDMQIPDYVSNEASDLIRKILVKEPSQRISLVHAIDHEWARLRVPSASELSRIKGVETTASLVVQKGVETVTAVAGEGLVSPQLGAAAAAPPSLPLPHSGHGSPGASSAGCAPTLTSVHADAIDSGGGRAASDDDRVAPAGWASASSMGAGAGAQEGASPTSPKDSLQSYDPTRPLPEATANLIDALRFDPATRAGDTRPLGPGDGGKEEDPLDSPEDTVLPAATANFLGYLWASQEDDDTSNLYSEPASPFGKGKAKTRFYDSAGAKGVRFADPEKKVRAQTDFVPASAAQELDCLSSPASSVSSLGRARLMTVSSTSMLPGAEQTTPSARQALRHLRDRIHRHREHNEAKRQTELDSLEREQKALQTTRRRLQAEREALRDKSNTSAVLAAAAASLSAGSGSRSPVTAAGGIGSGSMLQREAGSPSAPTETMYSFEDVRKWVQERRGSPLTSCSSATGTPGPLSPVSTDGHFTLPGSASGHPGAGGSSRPSWSSPSPRVFASSAPAADPSFSTTLGMAAPLGSRPEATEPQERPTRPAVLDTCQEAQGFSSGSAGAPANPLLSDAGGVHAGGAGARLTQHDDVHFPDDISKGSCHRIHSAAAFLLGADAEDAFADGDSPSRLDCGVPN